MSTNEQVLVEMQTFLQALASYPDRFAVDPRVTFEKYRSSLVAPDLTGQTSWRGPSEK